MKKDKTPNHFEMLRKEFPHIIASAEALGKAAREAGPLDSRQIHLIQLGAAAALRSEGSVRSHTRRALAEGASTEEILHSVISLTSTIGFPGVAAALAWVYKEFN